MLYFSKDIFEIAFEAYSSRLSKSEATKIPRTSFVFSISMNAPISITAGK